jgi:hypothetical protein
MFVILLIIVTVSCSGLANQLRVALSDQPSVGSMHQGMRASADDALGVLVTTAAQVSLTVPAVRQCYLAGETVETFDPTPLVNALLVAQANTDGDRGDVLQGCGVITVVGADIDGNTTDDDLNNKVSFEVTTGTIVSPACPQYLYGFTDQSTSYTSFCIAGDGHVDYVGGVKYSGPDYGLTPEERALYLSDSTGYRAILTPVFDLVGLASISYEVSMRCLATAKAAYALVFAQTNLELLSARFDAAFTDSLGPSGVAFTVGGSDGFMLVASQPGQVVNVTKTAWGTTLHSRYSPYNVSNNIIKLSALLIAENYGSEMFWAPLVLSELKNLPPNGSIEWSDDKLLVSATLYDYANSGAAPLGWINIVAIDKSDFTLKARARITNYAARIAVVVLFSVLFAVFLVVDTIKTWKKETRYGERPTQLQTQSDNL